MTDRKGCSQCEVGKGAWEFFRTPRGNERIQYDYRDAEGVLFSCIAKSLTEAQDRRDAWLRERRKKER